MLSEMGSRTKPSEEEKVIKILIPTAMRSKYRTNAAVDASGCYW